MDGEWFLGHHLEPVVQREPRGGMWLSTVLMDGRHLIAYRRRSWSRKRAERKAYAALEAVERSLQYEAETRDRWEHA